jgi:hypothetical protein
MTNNLALTSKKVLRIRSSFCLVTEVSASVLILFISASVLMFFIEIVTDLFCKKVIVVIPIRSTAPRDSLAITACHSYHNINFWSFTRADGIYVDV